MPIKIEIVCEPHELAGTLTEMLSAFKIVASAPAAAPAPVAEAVAADVAARDEAPRTRTRKPKDAPAAVIEGEATVIEAAAPAPAPAAPPPPPPAPPPEPEVPPPSIDELRAEISRIVSDDFSKQALVAEVLASVGAKKLPDIAESDRAAVLAKLKAIA